MRQKSVEGENLTQVTADALAPSNGQADRSCPNLGRNVDMEGVLVFLLLLVEDEDDDVLDVFVFLPPTPALLFLCFLKADDGGACLSPSAPVDALALAPPRDVK